MGIFTWADGSTYESFWRKGRRHGLGVFRPPPPLESRRGAAATERHASPSPPAGGAPWSAACLCEASVAFPGAMPRPRRAQVGSQGMSVL